MIEKILSNKFQECLSGLDIYENASSLILSRIVIKDECRNGGVGTNIMTDLIKYADSNKQIVALTPSSDFGGNKNKLIQFYKRFGFKHNKGQYKSYEFKDTMIRYPRLNETIKENKGGLAKVPTKKEIIEKFKIDSSELDKEIEMGIKIELEHTNSKEMAEKIAMQHLIEMPDYYTRLKKVEKKGEEEWKQKLKESVARELRNLI